MYKNFPAPPPQTKRAEGRGSCQHSLKGVFSRKRTRASVPEVWKENENRAGGVKEVGKEQQNAMGGF